MDTTSIEWVNSGSRWLSAGSLLLAYAGLCGWVHRRWQQRGATPLRDAPATATPRTPTMQAPTLPPSHSAGTPWVVYASQSGQAQAWAQHSALVLQGAHPGVRVLPLDELSLDDLQTQRLLLFVVSTTGEGDAPDNGLDFERRFFTTGGDVPPPPALPQLRYGLLALGDRDYSDFCGFGRRLDAGLQQRGAQPLFARIDAHQADAGALAAWRRELGHLIHPTDPAQAPDAPPSGLDEPAVAPFTPWRVMRSELLNPGSAGQPLVQLRLQPADGGALPPWQAGDLAQLLPRDGQAGVDKPRDYSIANLPEDGELRLLVRRALNAEGRAGRVSGWLTSAEAGRALQLGDTLQVRLRPHAGFRLSVGPQVPLVLVGNGSGLAGLRAHLQQRAAVLRASGQSAPPQCAWLVLGERNRAHDALLDDELQAWLRDGTLSRLDRVYSRDTPEAPHVQHRLRQEAARLRDWVAAGAHVLVCGSLRGMGQGVNEAMREILGEAAVNALTRSGRIHRDLY